MKKYVPKKTRLKVLERDNYTCQYCGKKMIALLKLYIVHGTNNPITLDHVKPRAHGGGHSEKNLVVACQRCNKEKADKLILPMSRTPKGKRKRSEAELLGDEWVMLKTILGIKKQKKTKGKAIRPSKFLLWWLRFQNRYLRIFTNIF